MIAVRDLTLELGGTPVIAALSASFAHGRVTAILGPNGAGKTSLIRALAGLLPPASGMVTIDDVALATLPPADRARRIGYLPQNGEAAWSVSVRELVSLGRLPHRSRFAALSPADEAAIDAALTATDTRHLADRPLDTLSGGEKGRTGIARVLATEPDWILADEPLGSLDPPHQRDVLKLFRAAAEGGRGVVTVLHQLDAAARVADDVLLLREGRAVAQGPRDAVLTPEHLEATFGMAFEIMTGSAGVAILPRD